MRDTHQATHSICDFPFAKVSESGSKLNVVLEAEIERQSVKVEPEDKENRENEVTS